MTILQCQVCGGTGRWYTNPISVLAGELHGVCPACRGAGELEVTIPEGRLVECKICLGKGTVDPTFNTPFALKKLCEACKGLGKLERPIISESQSTSNVVSAPSVPRLTSYEYDIAVSFAGENREIVDEYCRRLREAGVRVFYDQFEEEEANLWGKDLYDYFDKIYRKKARYCIIFISEFYATKVWPTKERRSAQARALIENEEYVLPVRLDDTEIPGIPPTIGHKDFRVIGLEGLLKITLQKIGMK